MFKTLFPAVFYDWHLFQTEFASIVFYALGFNEFQNMIILEAKSTSELYDSL
jgi:hypothetical protein